MALCALALAGCSGPKQQGPSAEQWAGQVCGALTPWRTEVAELNTRTAQQMAAATTPAQTRDNLVALMAGAQSATESARAAVAAAGTPQVAGGDAVARSFVAALAGTRDAYAKARADLQALPTGDQTAFYDGVEGVLTRLNDDYRGAAVDPSQLDSPELRRAFDGIASCR